MEYFAKLFCEHSGSDKEDMILLSMILACLILCTKGKEPFQLRSKDQGETIDSAVVDVLQRCYSREGLNAVFFLGDVRPVLEASGALSDSLSVVLIENDKGGLGGFHGVKQQHGLLVFVMVLSERYSAQQLFSRIKISGWWNYAAPHVILMRSGSSRRVSCSVEARDSLLTAWKMDVLSSVFLCTVYVTKDGSETESVLAYSYNPFSEAAPQPWRMSGTYAIGPTLHPWTLFEQKYDPELTTCSSIKFENKTINLNGFKIAATVKPHGLEILKSPSKTIEDLQGTDSHILKAIWKQMNASIRLKTYDSSYKFGLSLENGSVEGMIAELVYKKYDVNLNTKYVMQQSGISFTSVISTTGLYIVTNHRGLKPPLTKIVDFMNVNIILGVVLICIVTVLLSGYSIDQSTSPSVMDVPRLLLGWEVSYLPTSAARRFLLVSTMFLTLLVNSVFQGKLAALVTIPASHRQVNTIVDIDELDYEIHGFKFLSDFLPHHLASRYHDTGRDNIGFCEALLNATDAACLVETSQLYTVVGRRNLHVSRETLFTFFESYATRTQWPLYDRFNGLVMRFFEGGLMLHWRSEKKDEMRKINSSNEGGFTVIRLEVLVFAFKMLGVGLAVSTLVFAVELFASWAKLRYARHLSS